MNYFMLLFFVSHVLLLDAQTKTLKKSLPLSEASPESVGMSKERLARIDSMCKDAINKKQIPGAVTLVARNGKIVYYKAFGMADCTSGKLLKRDDIFRIASQTKAITCTAVMMLWEEGKFNLDDPISDYIPEFSNVQVLDSFNEKDSSYTAKPAAKQITIRHLLTHTSGIGYGAIDTDERFKKIFAKANITDAFTTANVSNAGNIKKLAKLPLHHNPGEKFTYGENMDVLGYFIERISGMPLDVFYKTRIFDPLGMNDTRFYLSESNYSRLVSLQTLDKETWVKYPVTFYDPEYPVKGAKSFFSGGAGLTCTAKDYATFLQMYLNKGELNGVRLLSRATVQVIMSNQIGNLFEDEEGDYGLAFMIVNQKGQDAGGKGSAGTFEWSGYFNTQYFADPKEKIIAIILKQSRGVKDETKWKFPLLVEQAIDD